MDCCYINRNENNAHEQILPNIASPDMFDSGNEGGRSPEAVVNDAAALPVSPEKPSQAELLTKSDNYLLARINKFLTGVPPPPKHTICQSDCSEFLLRIYENRRFFWTSCPLSEKKIQQDVTYKSPEQTKESISRSNTYQRTRNTSRNLSNAFDACDLKYQNSLNNDTTVKDLQTKVNSFNSRVDLSVTDDTQKILDPGKGVDTVSDQVLVNSNECKTKQMSSKLAEEQPLRYHTITEKEVATLPWSEAYQHRFHGIHYNRNKAIEEYENLTMKLCERYIGAETQSTCTAWFSKQAPGSARKRSLLAKRDNGQSPGKRLSHLTRRRRTFSSANLQGLGLSDKKQLLLNIKKPFSRKGKSPRGKSPRGKSPRGKSARGKSPRSSAKKKVVRRLTLDGLSPLKSKLETSKRALFQSPTSDRAGPSKLFTNGSNPQNIKRALFPTPNKRESDSEDCKRVVVEETRKRKSEEELEGPRYKWAKSLSFDCPHELHNNMNSTWENERHSSSNILEKAKTSFSQGRSELSDTHRKKLLWAVAEALRSKGIGMSHPQFKQHASNLARTIKKFMPDLENRNIPRKPGSTSDRMLKLAKHHVLFIVEATPSD